MATDEWDAAIAAAEVAMLALGAVDDVEAASLAADLADWVGYTRRWRAEQAADEQAQIARAPVCDG